jgi:hypothetical protein
MNIHFPEGLNWTTTQFTPPTQKSFLGHLTWRAEDKNLQTNSLKTI